MGSKKEQISRVSFTWSTGTPSMYDISDPTTARFKENETAFYRPAIGSLELRPNTGMYFWEIEINTDNARVGLCDMSCDPSTIMGNGAGTFSINLQNGACEMDGKTYKTLYRMIVPVAGGTFGFLYDSSKGTLQLYVNGEFHGTALDEAFNLVSKGILHPCVGLAALEANNRNIGVGKKKATVVQTPSLYSCIVLPRS